MEEKLTIQPIRKSFINLRQMKSLTCLILPAVPTAPQIKSQLSAIHRARVAWPLSTSPASSASVSPHPLPSTPANHSPPVLTHLKLTLTSGPLHMLRTLLRTHFPLARLFQVLTPRVGSLGRPPPPTNLLCSMCSQHQVPRFLNTMYTSPAQRQQGANSVDGMKK